MTSESLQAWGSRRLAWGVLGALTFITLACGGPSGPEMAGVSGKVTYQGKSVTRGIVSFQPVNADGTPATGPIDEDGYYTLQSVEPGDGARLGEYRVAISSRKEEEEPSNVAIPKAKPKIDSLTPLKYENPATSGLTASVKSGSNSLDFDLK